LTLIRRQAAPGARGTAPRRRRAKVAGIGALAVMLLALTGCTNDTFTRIGFPDPITTQGKVVVSLWQGSWIAGMLVGCVVWGLIVWAVIFHRKRGDKLPPQVRYNMPIEILYTVIPFVLIAVLFYYTAKDENVITATPANPAVTVNVIGFQWSWEFDYPQPNGAPPVKMTGAMWDPTKPDSRQTLPVLEVPVGERVQFNLTSPDVVHAFWVPEFLFKRDVMPDPKANHSDNIFQITEINKTGAFVGRCAEMCGTYHSMMNFELRVVEPNDFKAYLQQRIDGKTNAEALQAINQSPTAVTTKPFDTRRGEMAPQLTQASK
jgi:cytochrome c oxidase subunit II